MKKEFLQALVAMCYVFVQCVHMFVLFFAGCSTGHSTNPKVDVSAFEVCLRAGKSSSKREQFTKDC